MTLAHLRVIAILDLQPGRGAAVSSVGAVELMALATSWRQVLVADSENARPIVSSLLKGRMTFTPTAKSEEWEARGTGSFEQLFTRVFSSGVASPTGVVPEWSRAIPGELPAVGGAEHAA